jgi:hypothetical protein
MEALLKTGNITKKDVLAHPELVLDVLEFTHNQNKKAEEEAKCSNEALPPEQTITLSTRPTLVSRFHASSASLAFIFHFRRSQFTFCSPPSPLPSSRRLGQQG